MLKPTTNIGRALSSVFITSIQIKNFHFHDKHKEGTISSTTKIGKTLSLSQQILEAHSLLGTLESFGSAKSENVWCLS